MTKKLYRITLRGYYTVYVVAKDTTEAYGIVRSDLDKRDYGFSKGREMKNIELLAEDAEYPGCDIRLYVEDDEERNVKSSYSSSMTVGKNIDEITRGGWQTVQVAIPQDFSKEINDEFWDIL